MCVLSDALSGHISRGKDVDHRNLISLTGSPADSSGGVAPKKENNNGWGEKKDKVISEKFCLTTLLLMHGSFEFKH